MKKKVLIILFLVLFAIVSIMPLSASSESAAETRSVRVNFKYRRPITIHAESVGEDLYEFQVLVELDTQSLIAAGKMLPDGSDIRITDSDMETEIPFYIEPGTINTTDTRIWVRVPYIPKYSTKTIYIYYGNNTPVESASNATATFDLIYVTKLTVNYQWTGVSLPVSFNDPVIIAVATTGNYDPMAVPRIRSVNGTYFEIRMQETSHDADDHGPEEVPILVVDPGVWRLADGRLFEAEKYNTSAYTHGRTNSRDVWDTVTFNAPFSTAPVVFSTIMSMYNEPNIQVKTRQRSITSTSFQVAMEEEDINNPSPEHGTETIGWFAIEPGTGNNMGVPYAIGKTSDSVSHNWYTQSFPFTFSSVPMLFAWMQTRDGPDSCTTVYRNVGLSSFQTRVWEDSTYDEWHTTEIVGYIAWDTAKIPSPGLIHIRKYTAVEPTTEVGNEDRSTVTYTLTVYDRDGYVVPGAVVSLTGITESFNYSLETSEWGNVSFSVIPGDYQLRVYVICGTNNKTILSTTVTIDGDMSENRTLDLIKYEFTVFDRNGTTPIQGITLSFYDNTTAFNATSQPGGVGEIYLPYNDSGDYILTAWEGTTMHQLNITGGTTGANYVIVSGVSGNRSLNVRITTIATAPPISTFDLVIGEPVIFANWTDTISLQVRLHSGTEDIDVHEHSGRVDCYVYRGDDVVKIFSDLGSSTKGYYDLVFNTSILPAGHTYTLRFNASLDDYQDPVPLLVYLKVETVPTRLHVVWSSAVHYGDPFYIKIYYTDLLHNIPITGASVNMSIWGTNYTGISLGTYNASEGAYIYRIDSFMAEENTYAILLNVNLENYTMQEESIFVTVNSRIATMTPNTTVLNTYYNDPIGVKLDVADITNVSAKLPLDSAKITYTIITMNATGGGEIGNESIVLTGELSVNNGISELSLTNTSALVPGTYLIELYLEKSHYVSSDISIALTVNAIPLAVEGRKTYSVEKDVISGEGSVNIEFTVRDIGHNIEFGNANVTYRLIKDNRIIEEGSLSPIANGTYQLQLSFAGREIGTYIVEIVVNGTHYSGVVHTVTVTVDYVGGHVMMFGTAVPLYIFVPVLVLVVFGASVAGYYLVQYYILTPWEVRFLNKIISALEKGNIPKIEYTPRDEYIASIIKKEAEKLIIKKEKGGEGENA